MNKPNSRQFEQIPLDLVMSERPSLENFSVGENAQLISELHRVRAGIGSQFLYIWGADGCGKTHLLRALTPEQAERVPLFHQDVTLYTVDDVDALDADGLEALFVLMNAVRAHPGTCLVSSGSVAPLALDIRQDVQSRLSWGLVYEVHSLGAVAAREELRRLASVRGIVLGDDVLNWLGNYFSRDIRNLAGLLEKLDQYALSRKRRVTLPLLHEWFAEHDEERA